MATLTPGTHLSTERDGKRYRIEQHLGAGGYGDTYAALELLDNETPMRCTHFAGQYAQSHP